MHPSDEDLVAAYLEQGDQAAFRMLVERHQERIYGYLYALVRDVEIANDLFQETFVKAIHAMHARGDRYDDRGRWFAWIMRIARNAAFDHLRTRRKWLDVNQNVSHEGEDFWEMLPDGDANVEIALENSEDGELLEALIQKLPPEQREVLLLRHEAELSFKEIAEIMNCSINTALGRMRYALLNLRKMLTGEKKRETA